MSDREHFIATLQACYFGDRNAFDEIVRIYDKKENIIKEGREYIESYNLEYLHETNEHNLADILEEITVKSQEEIEILIKEVNKYKSRCKKAIEYINENWGHWCSDHCKYATETINILRGDDKE